MVSEQQKEKVCNKCPAQKACEIFGALCLSIKARKDYFQKGHWEGICLSTEFVIKQREELEKYE
jgi:hypothetical protein